MKSLILVSAILISAISVAQLSARIEAKDGNGRLRYPTRDFRVDTILLRTDDDGRCFVRITADGMPVTTWRGRWRMAGERRITLSLDTGINASGYADLTTARTDRGFTTWSRLELSGSTIRGISFSLDFRPDEPDQPGFKSDGYTPPNFVPPPVKVPETRVPTPPIEPRSVVEFDWKLGSKVMRLRDARVDLSQKDVGSLRFAEGPVIRFEYGEPSGGYIAANVTTLDGKPAKGRLRIFLDSKGQVAKVRGGGETQAGVAFELDVAPDEQKRG
jgi:hypothetical protein